MSVRDFLQDDAGNLVIVNNDLALADGLRAIVQGIQGRVSLRKREYWLDESEGVDWTGEILGEPRNPLTVKGILSSAIASTPDVTQVKNTAYTVDPTTRRGTVDFTAATNLGIVSGQVNP